LLKIILAVSNDLVTDNRVYKVSESLKNKGFQVTLIGRCLSYSEPYLRPDVQVKRFKLWFNQSALFYANLNLRLFFYLIRARVDIVVANDLDTLPACWLAAKLRRKVLVFDSHELFIEVPELTNRTLIRKVWFWLEKILVPGVDFGYTVSPSIQNYYKVNYRKTFQLVRNAAVYRSSFLFNKKSEETIIIYQGALNQGRGLELMLETMPLLPHMKLWIVGAGDIEQELKRKVLTLRIAEKVIFFGRVQIADLFQYTSKAHMGISLEEDLGLNYRYALPNKIFDYVQARIPMVVSDLPEMRNLVETYEIGYVLSERSTAKLAETILRVEDEYFVKDSDREKLQLAARKLCWQNEEKELIALYQEAYERAKLRSGRLRK